MEAIMKTSVGDTLRPKGSIMLASVAERNMLGSGIRK